MKNAQIRRPQTLNKHAKASALVANLAQFEAEIGMLPEWQEPSEPLLVALYPRSGGVKGRDTRPVVGWMFSVMEGRAEGGAVYGGEWLVHDHCVVWAETKEEAEIKATEMAWEVVGDWGNWDWDSAGNPAYYTATARAVCLHPLT